MRKKLLQLNDLAERIWCAVMHDEITWPVHGRYRCRKCWREYSIAWGRNGATLDRGAADRATLPATLTTIPPHPVLEGDARAHCRTASACAA